VRVSCAHCNNNECTRMVAKAKLNKKFVQIFGTKIGTKNAT